MSALNFQNNCFIRMTTNGNYSRIYLPARRDRPLSSGPAGAEQEFNQLKSTSKGHEEEKVTAIPCPSKSKECNENDKDQLVPN